MARLGRGAYGPGEAFRHSRVDAYEDDPRLRALREETLPPTRFPRGRLVGAIFAVVLAFGIGQLMAYYGAIVGVFRAGDVGMPVLFLATLRFMDRLARARLHEQTLAGPTGLFPRASGWAVVAFSFIMTVTNVPQLAFGLAAGTIGFAAYSARIQLRSMGHPGAGVLVGPTIGTLAGYAFWLLARVVAGNVPGFSLASAIGGAVLAFAVIRAADRALQGLAAEAPSIAVATTTQAQRDTEKRTIVGLILIYVMYRFFLSSFIPYGPVVEWTLICLGMLFFAIVLAHRIGTVSTSGALPSPETRRHVQFVASLPDQRLAERAQLLDAFIEHGVGREQVVGLLQELYDELGIPPGEARAPLDAVVSHRQGQRRRSATGSLGGPALRRRLVSEALDGLGAAAVHPTTTTARAPREPGRPGSAPSPRSS